MIANKDNAIWTSYVYEQGVDETSWKEYQGELTFVPKEIVEDVNSSTSIPEALAKYSDGSIAIETDITKSLSVAAVPDISTASYDSISFSIGSEESSPYGLAFSTDGTKMYIVGYSSDTVYQYTLTTGFDLSTASYDSISFSIGSEESSPYGLAFSTDGTKMYIVGASSGTVYQYTLTTGFDLSTASYDSISLYVYNEDSVPVALAFSTDGTKMYMTGYINKYIYQYTLSTPWDLSTASYDNITFSTRAQEDYPYGLAFSTEGTKMYVVGEGNDTVYQYTLPTAWDLSTVSYDSISFDVSNEDNAPTEVIFNTNYTKMYIMGATNDTIYQYTVTPNPAAEYAVNTTATTLYEPTIPSMFVLLGSTEAITSMVDQEMVNLGSTDGEVLLDFDNNVDRIFTQYDSVEYAVVDNYNLTTASYTGNSIDVGTQDTYPKGVTLSPDGTKMFIAGEGNHSVYRYDLSTAWDVSTAVYLNSYGVADEESYVRGVVFSTAGDAMYIVGTSSDKVHKYTLGAAWDLTTASYSSEYVAVGTEDGHPSSLAFSSDGTKLFVLGYDNDAVFTYDMTAAWDLTTASYSSVSFSVTTEESSPLGLTFNSDGTKMYTVGTSASAAIEYVLGTAWDIATATASGITFSISEQAQNSEVFFGDNGTKMYVVGYDTNLVCEYDVGTATYGLNTQINSIEVADGQTKLLFTENVSAYSVTVNGRSASTAYEAYEDVGGNIKATTGISVENVGKRFAQIRIIGDDTDEVVSAKLNMWKE